MSKPDPVAAWFATGMDAWLLGMEAANVMALRTLKLAAGGAAAQVEARRMVEEKVAAAIEVQARAMTGRLGTTWPEAASGAIAHYRRAVSANRRRLTRR